MKTNIYLLLVLAATNSLVVGQSPHSSNLTIDSLQNFNKSYWLSYISQKTNRSQADINEFIGAQKRQYIKDTYYSSQKNPSSSPVIQQACTNIDFETGTTAGWNLSTGFHPLYNASGCCPTAGGAQAIMSGNATDPCGGFPVVAPGGNFSIRLGNNGTGGVADRMEQKFFVTAANANFTYKYAVVFQDPGHVASEQPAFTIEMIDTLGNAIPCTYYNVAAGANIPGFLNSATCPNVIYKPWTNVVVDLTNYIGQNVIIRFSTYDCALGGHYGYAYIDGSCVAFQQTTSDTLCAGMTKQICAPPGFGSYVWSGGNINGNTNQCVTVGPGFTYTVQTTLVTGCQGPAFYYPMITNVKPLAAFTTAGNNCTMTVGFNNTSSISAGSIVSHNWNFGDGNNSTLLNPTHTYANPGNYNVRLITASNKGCLDTVFNAVPVNSPPIANFTQTTVCQGSPVTFNDLSVASQGVINNWNWNFGDASTNSLQQHPSHIYSTPGTYSVTLFVSSSNGCADTAVHLVNVNALPNPNFNVANSCFGTQSVFNNSSSIPSGSISNWMWDIDGNGTVDYTNQNITHNYPAAGTYTVNLTASSNANCIKTFSSTVTIHPLPTINISGNNVCLNAVTQFINNSSITNGNQITSYNWNFGNSTSSSQTSPQVIYTSSGNYMVTLSATSNNNCLNSGSTIIQVHPNPVPLFSTANVCHGNTNMFNNQSTISGGNITNWMWDVNGDGNTDSTSANPTFVYPNPGTYSVSLTAISNYNCIKTYTSTVMVHPRPAINFTANNTCLGSATSFTNNSTIGFNNVITNYHWNFGSGNMTTTGQNPWIIYPNYGNYVVNLTATSNFNCTSTGSMQVSVYANPNANFIASTTCHNQATQFTNQSNIAVGNISKYRWDFDSDNTWDDSTNVNATYIYPAFGTMNAKLEAISNNNCRSQKTNVVIVHGNPTADFSVNSVCLGDNTNFQNLSASPDGTITSYQWDFNGDNVIDNVSQSPVHNYATNGVYLAKLEVQTQYGCTNVKSKSVYVNAKPVAQFTANKTNGCPSLCVPFANNSYITAGTIVTYQWLFGDNSDPNYVKNPTHCYESGIYSVNLKCVSDSGCISTFNSPALVNVYPSPTAGFNVDPEEIDEFQPIVNVQNTSTGASAVSYTFDFGLVYNTANFTHTLNLNGPGQVLLMQIATNTYGCKDTALKLIEIRPGFVIYLPNAFTPNGDNLNDGFGAKGVGIESFQLQVYDRWGHLIFESNDINDYWQGNAKGSSEPIEDGVYVWKAKVKDVFHKHHDLTGHVTVIK
jgi:gliding motility-associated-like protein